VALSRKKTCNFRHPMSLRHPVSNVYIRIHNVYVRIYTFVYMGTYNVYSHVCVDEIRTFILIRICVFTCYMYIYRICMFVYTRRRISIRMCIFIYHICIYRICMFVYTRIQNFIPTCIFIYHYKICMFVYTRILISKRMCILIDYIRIYKNTRSYSHAEWTYLCVMNACI